MSPFLPEPEAAPVAPKKRPRKVLLIWVLLVIMFLAIWQVLNPSTPPSEHVMQAAPAHSDDSFWTSTLMMTLPFVLVGLFVFWILRAYRQNDAFNLAQEPGRLAMAHRRFGDAVDLFRATLPTFKKQPVYRAIATLNVAEAQLKAGRLNEVISTCAEIERSRMQLLGAGIRNRLATLTALTCALSGDLPLADRWADEARTRIAKNKNDRILHAASLCVAEAILACRKKNAADAVRLLDQRWLELRYALSADAMRMVEVVRAFAEAQTGPRGSNVVAERLIRIEPIIPGEFAWLGVAWPEMSAFLKTTVDSGAPGKLAASASSNVQEPV